ncbi:MAG: A/G-specific adenine glycosylase, partial [Thaumarchaeota archaeon S15]
MASIEVSLPSMGIGAAIAAAAILALACGERHAILDGNVKRILARHDDIAGWPGRAAVGRRLWRAAEKRLPRERIADYTQAMMDLGALVCTRNNPDCGACPVAGDCRALAAGRVAR